MGLALFQRGGVDTRNKLRIGNCQMYLLLDGEQHANLQTGIFYRVHRAGSLGKALVSPALIIDIYPFGCDPGHGPAAVGAFQKTAEQIKLFLFGGCAGVPL